MKRSNKTYDGKPLCMGVSGFTHYSTERADAPTYPPAVLTPEDLVEQIKAIQKICSNPKIQSAIKLLAEHVADTNNPHQTTVSQLLGTIVDVMYEQFLERTSSSLTKEEFEKVLFEVIHVATDQEISEGICTTAVISVYSARRLIDQHDADSNAHASLISNIVPGSPIIEDPTYAFFPQFGFLPYYMLPVELELTDDEEEKPYTYVGIDGFLHTAAMNILPVDYACGNPMIPCFESRRNLIIDSTDMSIFTMENLTTLKEAEEAPDRTVTATAIYQSDDGEEREQLLYYPNFILEQSQPVTFSIFVKPESQTIFKISWEDTLNSGIDTYAVFDLARNSSVIVNHLNRYAASLQKLSNGWYRCSFSMYNTDGRIAHLRLSFHDDIDLDDVANATWTAQSSGAICGYLWGVQLEYGFQLSPYIPTSGKVGVRKSIHVRIPLHTSWYTQNENTFHIDYQNGGSDPSKLITEYRPVCLLKNGDYKCLYIRHRGNSFALNRYYTYTNATGTVSYDITTIQDELYLPDDRMYQVTHGIDSESLITRLNDSISVMSHTALLNPATDMYLGSDGDSTFYNGYIASVIIYPIKVSEEEAQFLNGEEYE